MISKIKKTYLILIALFILLIFPTTIFANESEPNISSKSVLLIDNKTSKKIFLLLKIQI